MYKLIFKNIITFEVDLNTAKDFENLIYELEELGVYMDFIFNIDTKFCTMDTRLIHIEKLKEEVLWEHISTSKYNYYESDVVTVDLKYNTDIYFIFASLYLNKSTSLIYDFYEGKEDVFVSFFVNKFFKKRQDILKERQYINDNIYDDLSEDISELGEADID